MQGRSSGWMPRKKWHDEEHYQQKMVELDRFGGKQVRDNTVQQFRHLSDHCMFNYQIKLARKYKNNPDLDNMYADHLNDCFYQNSLPTDTEQRSGSFSDDGRSNREYQADRYSNEESHTNKNKYKEKELEYDSHKEESDAVGVDQTASASDNSTTESPLQRIKALETEVCELKNKLTNINRNHESQSARETTKRKKLKRNLKEQSEKIRELAKTIERLNEQLPSNQQTAQATDYQQGHAIAPLPANTTASTARRQITRHKEH